MASELYWLEVTRAEIAEQANNEYQLVRSTWDDQVQALAHVMKSALYTNIGTVRDAVDARLLTVSDVSSFMGSDYFFGYVFGMAANFIDATGISRETPEAHKALLAAHTIAFGEVRGGQLFEQQSRRQLHPINTSFEDGMEAAHKDVNSFKRVFGGKEAAIHSNLLEHMIKLLPN